MVLRRAHWRGTGKHASIYLKSARLVMSYLHCPIMTSCQDEPTMDVSTRGPTRSPCRADLIDNCTSDIASAIKLVYQVSIRAQSNNRYLRN
ncbi:hypothetical protein PHET_09622 [Paragonimus heterotremus]|uniref:Uncharacterized protein n=1 Tax=Paragonimus heterotremus TaxID=100268 RepID=A0A8J4WU35_9TREM|nr:hypothetical protein PHET_09622 [Paragonimus heterotremus]